MSFFIRTSQFWGLVFCLIFSFTTPVMADKYRDLIALARALDEIADLANVHPARIEEFLDLLNDADLQRRLANQIDARGGNLPLKVLIKLEGLGIEDALNIHRRLDAQLKTLDESGDVAAAAAHLLPDYGDSPIIDVPFEVRNFDPSNMNNYSTGALTHDEIDMFYWLHISGLALPTSPDEISRVKVLVDQNGRIVGVLKEGEPVRDGLKVLDVVISNGDTPGNVNVSVATPAGNPANFSDSIKKALGVFLRDRARSNTINENAKIIAESLPRVARESQPTTGGIAYVNIFVDPKSGKIVSIGTPPASGADGLVRIVAAIDNPRFVPHTDINLVRDGRAIASTDEIGKIVEEGVNEGIEDLKSPASPIKSAVDNIIENTIPTGPKY